MRKNHYRNTKKALGGLLGLLGSFLAFFSLAFPLSAFWAAFLFPAFLKIIEIHMIHHYNIPALTVPTTDVKTKLETKFTSTAANFIKTHKGRSNIVFPLLYPGTNKINV